MRLLGVTSDESSARYWWVLTIYADSSNYPFRILCRSEWRRVQISTLTSWRWMPRPFARPWRTPGARRWWDIAGPLYEDGFVA